MCISVPMSVLGNGKGDGKISEQMCDFFNFLLFGIRKKKKKKSLPRKNRTSPRFKSNAQITAVQKVGFFSLHHHFLRLLTNEK